MSAPRILVAGIGNIFLGDDAFGVEVVRRLQQRPLPAGVEVVDYGIRSYDLAYALLDGPDATVFVDATQQGGRPGDLFVLALEMDDLAQSNGAPVDAHSMNPLTALQLVQQYGGRPERLYLVGCEPATLVAANGEMGLSAVVEAAVPRAVELVEELVAELLDGLREAAGEAESCTNSA